MIGAIKYDDRATLPAILLMRKAYGRKYFYPKN